jgi:ferric-dicitrate binding protein FerR (iron transport regulator)
MWRQTSAPLAVLLMALSFAPRAFGNSDSPQQVSAPAGASRARVVSLSFVHGTVIVRSPGSSGWTRATLDTPLEEGASIATARHSFAEVQFENGSTLRIGEISQIDFAQMRLAPDSGHVNDLTLVFGFATMHVIPERHDSFVLHASGAGLEAYGRTEFRTDLTHRHLRVEVFKGHLQLANSNQSQRLGKNRSLTYEDGAAGAFQVTDTLQADDWDKWVQARDRQADLAACGSQIGANGLLYGWDDLIPFGNMGQIPEVYADVY